MIQEWGTPPHQLRNINACAQYLPTCVDSSPTLLWPYSIFKIVWLCGWHNKLWSISSVNVWLWGLRLGAVHILSAERSIKAGKRGVWTINTPWYSGRCDNWRIHALMDEQPAAVRNDLRPLWVHAFRASVKRQVSLSAKLNVFTFLGVCRNVLALVFVYSSNVAFKVHGFGLVLQDCAVMYVTQSIPKPRNHPGTACFFVLKPQNPWQSIRGCVCVSTKRGKFACWYYG